MRLRINELARSRAARLFALLQLLAGFALWPTFAHAQCSLGNAGLQTLSLTLPAQISIPRDAPVGTVLAQASVSDVFDSNNPTGVWCSSPVTAIYANQIGGLATSNYVIPTPVPGIGYTLTGNGDAVSTHTASLPASFFTSGCGQPRCWGTIATPLVLRLVKTGPITGVQTPLPVGRWMTLTVGGILAATVSVMNPVQVIGQTCSVTTPSVAVTLGPVPAKTFSGVGSTSNDMPFRIGLDCTGVTTNVGVTFTDVNNPGNTTTTLSLTPDSSANGVGIQIVAPNSSVVQYGADASTAGNPGQLMLGTVRNTSTNLMFGGRYVQTASSIHPGSADGIATFTMSYQ